MRVLSKTEQKLFCNAIANSQYKFLFEMTLQTGLRLGEIMGLCWSDINFRSKIITVNHTLKRVSSRSGDKKTHLAFFSPKTENSLREIPMTNFIYTNLKNMYLNKPDSIDQVFCTKYGTLNDPRRIQQAFSAIVKKLDFKGVTFHTLRHLYVKHTAKKYIWTKAGTPNYQKWLDSPGFLFLPITPARSTMPVTVWSVLAIALNYSGLMRQEYFGISSSFKEEYLRILQVLLSNTVFI